ncbi:MAG TPA: ATP-dependent DNA helicase [Actinomycetales bacterium]|nr:ATP-dependent DNA helicase [Actinomycetales bacterium]
MTTPDEPFRLVRPSAAGRPGSPSGHGGVLDPTQRRVVEHRRGQGPLVVLGAPGTGKTTVLVESVVARVDRDGVDPARVLVLGPSRRAAAALRDRVTAALARTVTEPLARTPHSFAFALLRRAAVLSGDPPPRLISGPEQDRILADLLAGHAEGVGRRPDWPTSVAPALGLRGFRDELRDLMMRALERGLTPEDLSGLGKETDRPEWVAAAQVMDEYLEVTALATPGAYDPAAIVDTAAALLDADDELLAAERARWQLIAVDDHHESGAAFARLLDLLAGGGTDLLLTGDPDASTQTFRGADPGLIAAAAERYRRANGSPAEVVRLGTRWRPSVAVADVTRRVAAAIGTREERAHREASVSVDAARGSVRSAVLRSANAEGAFVAHTLREAHLLRGVPWSQMAVIVRSAGRTGALRRALSAAGVPVSVPSADLPVRDEPAVRPFRLALRVALRPEALDVDTAVELLTSPLGGADTLALRRLRQVLLAEERLGGGGRPSDDLLVEVLADPLRLAGFADRDVMPALRVARVLAAGREAAAEQKANAETVLWRLWSTSGLAEPWRRTALAGGAAGRRADRDLDAIVALFDAASRFVDRLPASGPGDFLAHLDAQDVPADTLAERAVQGDSVALVTAQTSAGREWDLVVLAGLQEGAWPDLRLRGSLLGAQALVDVLTGRDESGSGSGPGARAQVLADERRLLHVAVSRARRSLVVTAVRDADERPSPFLDLVDPLPVEPKAVQSNAVDPKEQRPLVQERSYARVPRQVTLPALVAELRQVVLTRPGARDGSGALVTEERRTEAVTQLARLARAGVPGAHPDTWYGVAPLSDDGPLRGEDEAVRVSPSKVESFGNCPLRWMLETSGGTAGDSTSQAVGTLVHEIAAEAPEGSADELADLLEQRWAGLGLPNTWVGVRERQRAEDMVRRLAQYLGKRQRDLVAVEQDFDVTVGRARLRGRVDRLERDVDGRLVVIDFKTGSSRPSPKDAIENPQLGTYQVAVEEGGFGGSDAVSGGAALVQLGGKYANYAEQKQPPLADADDPGWAKQRVIEVADGMAGAAFDAVQNDLCRVCPVTATCPLQPGGRHVGEQ